MVFWGYIRVGALRLLAVTTAARLEVLPDVPSPGDYLPGYEAGGFMGIGMPNGTPAKIVDRLDKEVNAGLADPKMKARLADVGFRQFIVNETEKWGKVVKFAGIKPE